MSDEDEEDTEGLDTQDLYHGPDGYAEETRKQREKDNDEDKGLDSQEV